MKTRKLNKTIVISLEAPPVCGGAGIYFSNLIRELGRKVDFVTHISSKKSFNSRAMYFNWPKKLWYLCGLVTILRYCFKYDRMIINDPTMIYSCGFLPKSILAKTIVIIHGRERRLESPSVIDKFFMFDFFYRRTLKFSRNSLCVSNSIKNTFVAEYRARGSFSVFHNGIDRMFEYKGAKSDKLFILVTACRLESGKGLFELINKIGPLILEREVVWNIYGDGPEREKLQDLIVQKQLTSKVILNGRVSSEKLAAEYQNAHCFILNSKLEESFGLCFLEAAASGCHVIANYNHGVVEALKYVDCYTAYDDNSIESVLVELISNGINENRCHRFVDNLVSEMIDENYIIL